MKNTPPHDALIRSTAGFLAALLIGALIPKTFSFLVRRVMLRSFREVFVLALAGWLTDRLIRLLTSESKTTTP